MRRSLIACALFGVGTLVAQAASVPSLTWTQAFPVNQAPTDVHFIARYVDARGRTHRLEAWRHGEDFLHRKTDSALDLYVIGADSQARYRLLDHRRRISVDVTRVNLYRVGVFSNAFGLAHVLDAPPKSYRIEPARFTTKIAARLGSCQWRRLHGDVTRTDSLICWSSRWGLPLWILDAANHRPSFEIIAADAGPIKAADRIPPPAPPGYARIEADDDIDPRAD